MGRWTQYDEDSYRLPEGMKRIGYDADTGQYLFEDNTGTYKGLPGSYYGHMYPADAPEPPQRIPVAQARSPSVEPRLPSPEVESSTRLRKAMRRATLPSMPTALRNLRRSLTTVRKPWHRDRSSDDDQAVQTSSAESKPLWSADNAHSTAAVTRGSKSAPSAPRSSTTSRTLVSTECKSPAPSSTFSASSKHPTRPTTALTRESKTPASPSTGAVKVPKGAAPSRSATISTSRRSEVESGHTRRAASDHAFTVRDSPILKRAVTVDASSKSKSTSPSKPTSTSKPPVLSTAPSKQTSASLGAAATSVQKIPSSRRQGSTSQVSSPVSVSAASPPASARPRRAASSASPRTTRPEATRTSRTMALALAAT